MIERRRSNPQPGAAERQGDARAARPDARGAARANGFFKREQIDRILAHLPAAIRLAVQFAYITGWRIPGEVLKLQWRHVDFEARAVRLDPHTTKNDEGRTFAFTDSQSLNFFKNFGGAARI